MIVLWIHYIPLGDGCGVVEKQLYGTQGEIFTPGDSVIVIAPVEDPAHLDERRAEMGLMPMKQYAKVLGEAYKMEVQMP